MPRPKKDGVKYSLYIDRGLEEALRSYAERNDLTLTAALERAIKVLLSQDSSSAAVTLPVSLTAPAVQREMPTPIPDEPAPSRPPRYPLPPARSAVRAEKSEKPEPKKKKKEKEKKKSSKKK